MTVNLEKLSQYVKSGQCVLKQHENDSNKTKSKYCETFRDIIDYGYNILYSILCYFVSCIGLGQVTGSCWT